MGAGSYVVGLLGLAGVLLACGGAAWVVVARRLGEGAMPAGERLLAFGLLATLFVVGVHLVPGALGVLSEGAVLLCSALLLVVVWFVVRRGGGVRAGHPAPVARSGRTSTVLAGAGVAAVAVYLVALVLDQAGAPTTHADMMAFHLPGVAEWMRTGSVWGIHQWTPDWGFGYYPANGDVLLLAAMLPWHSDFAVRLVDAPAFALLGLGTYALARELRAPAAPAALAAATLLALPAVTVVGVQGLPDTAMLATFAGGCAFLLRHARTRARADLVLAGVGLGLAFGTKWYGPTAVVAVLVVWAVCGRGRRLRDGGLLVALILGAGGFWLVRNLAAVGNPVFPLRVAPFGVTIFDAPPDPLRAASGHPLARYLLNGNAWDRYLLPDFGRFLSAAAVVLLVGLAVAAAVALRRRSGAALAVAAAAGLILVLYVVTPFSGQGLHDQPNFAWVNVRYGMPALVPAAALTAWAIGRLRRAGLVLQVAALAGIADGLRLGLPVSGRWLLVALVLGLAAVAPFALRRPSSVVDVLRRRPPRIAGGAIDAPRRSALAIGAAAVVLAAAGIAGYALQRHLLAHRYQGLDPVLDALRAGAPAGERIGLAGDVTGTDFTPVLPAFGPRFGNRVGYAGAVERGMLRRAPTAAAFERALRAGDYDLLLVARSPAHVDRPVHEAGWALAAGYVPALDSARFALYRRTNVTVRGSSSAISTGWR